MIIGQVHTFFLISY